MYVPHEAVERGLPFRGIFTPLRTFSLDGPTCLCLAVVIWEIWKNLATEEIGKTTL